MLLGSLALADVIGLAGCAGSAAPIGDTERIIIYTGEIVIRVTDVDAAATRASTITTASRTGPPRVRTSRRQARQARCGP